LLLLLLFSSPLGVVKTHDKNTLIKLANTKTISSARRLRDEKDDDDDDARLLFLLMSTLSLSLSLSLSLRCRRGGNFNRYLSFLREMDFSSVIFSKKERKEKKEKEKVGFNTLKIQQKKKKKREERNPGQLVSQFQREEEETWREEETFVRPVSSCGLSIHRDSFLESGNAR